MPVLTSTEPQLFLPLSLSRAILKDKQPLLHHKAEGSSTAVKYPLPPKAT